MTIDKSYLEKLREVLQDEKKVVNYKTVSIMIGVHVNIAKQMLFHVYKTEKSNGKQLYATYYISGLVPRKVFLTMSSKGRKEEEDERACSDDSSQQSLDDNLDMYLVSICREKDLENIKAKYSKIFSIHIYSLSAFPIENYDALESLVEFPLRDSEGRTPVDFGPVICSASQKLLANNAKLFPTANITEKNKNDFDKKSQVKEKSTGSVKEDKIDKNDAKVDGLGGFDQKAEKQAKPTAEKKDTNRLRSMFATASTKSKSQTKKAEDGKSNKTRELNEDRNEQVKDIVESKTVKNESKNKETRKRKRIRDVLSSDSEEDQRVSEDEEDPQVECEIPRKRIQLESDSDDDDFKQTSKKREDSPLEKKSNTVPGRRRVAKMVSKSYLDKDGFLVTTKEQIMVSEDESTEEKLKEPKIPEVDEPKSATNESKKSTDQQRVKPASSGKSTAGKTKQASLMSFFQKK